MAPQSKSGPNRLRPCTTTAKSPAAASSASAVVRDSTASPPHSPAATAQAQIARRPGSACQTSVSVQTARIDSQRHQALAQDEPGVDRMDRKDGQRRPSPRSRPGSRIAGGRNT